jgi:hypothetical protein
MIVALVPLRATKGEDEEGSRSDSSNSIDSPEALSGSNHSSLSSCEEDDSIGNDEESEGNSEDESVGEEGASINVSLSDASERFRCTARLAQCRGAFCNPQVQHQAALIALQQPKTGMHSRGKFDADDHRSYCSEYDGDNGSELYSSKFLHKDELPHDAHNQSFWQESARSTDFWG